VGRLVLHDVARDGRVLLERNTTRIEAVTGVFGGEERDLSWLEATSVADLSADGSALLFAESGEAGGPDYTTYLRPTDGGPAARLGPGRAMALSPDGRWAASVPARAPGELHLLPIGVGEPRVLRHESASYYDFVTWLRDGRLLYTARGAGNRPRTWVRAPDGREPTAVTAEGIGVYSPAESPDGHVIANTPDGPRLVSIDGTSAPREVPGLGHDWPLGWIGPDLLVRLRRTASALPVVLVRVRPDGRREPFFELAPPDRSGLQGLGPIAISEDGRKYAYSPVRRWSDLYVVTMGSHP
jgi:hypothetical protein